MVRRLVENVTLLGEDGLAAHFPVGTLEDKVPAWAAPRISNPAVWSVEEDAPAVPVVVKVEVVPAESEQVDIPPKAGAGSSAKAWVAYARSQGVPAEQNAKRDDVIAACEAAGVPTE